MIESARCAFAIPESLKLIEPLGYLDFIKAMRHARIVITDSGGIQEETTVLGIPCITVRENTERPITIDMGTNVLVGADPEKIRGEAARILDGAVRAHRVPPLWDGKTAGRIADIVERHFPV
jgi:UDP-N-acetylglucosamine 2-epimerase (non-hydrolysing)